MSSLVARLSPGLERARCLRPGVMLCAVIAMAATFVTAHYGGPLFLFALLFGTTFHYLHAHPATRSGIEWCSTTVLRLGVALLGARITAAQVLALGWQTAALTVMAVLSTLALGVLLAQRFGLARWQGVISGGAVAICGASAALALSSVLPRRAERDPYTLLVVVAVTATSALAMVVYPILSTLLGLSPHEAGVFLGASIHDVAQVVGAGYSLGHEAGDTATLVKLFRVSLLAGIVVVIAALYRSATVGTEARRTPLLPWFLGVFVLLLLANSLGWIPAVAQQGLGECSRICLVVAIAALGVRTSFQEVAQAGWRPLLLIAVETMWIAGVVLATLVLTRPD